MRLSPRDTWPEMRVTIVPLPWTWALVPRGYRDDVDGGLHGLATFSWLFLRLEWWGNRPLFTDAKASDIGGQSQPPEGA